MTTVTSSVRATCAASKRAALTLQALPSGVKDGALEAIADAVAARADEVLEANAADLLEAREGQYSGAFLDKLRLDHARLEGMVAGVRKIAALPDPVGEVIEGFRLPNGLDVRKVRVPLGVIALVYEARPNVTIDATALCLKSGNAVVLRGSSAARRSNAALADIAGAAASLAGLPEGAIALLQGGREEIAELATQIGLVDLIVPRGGEGLKTALKGVATVPVIYAASGNCHVYVDRSADLDQACAIVLNAKVQRPGVCNAAETLLVDAAIAGAAMPRLLNGLQEAGVTPHLDPAEDDLRREYLSMDIAVAVVDGVDAAIAHVNEYGTGHTEAIVTTNLAAAQRFTDGVDAAAVMVNASTAFTDGEQFGFGAEIGISTQKLHARGPMGLPELTSTKWIAWGDGQIRPA